jgi:hypothetical protein
VDLPSSPLLLVERRWWWWFLNVGEESCKGDLFILQLCSPCNLGEATGEYEAKNGEEGEETRLSLPLGSGSRNISAQLSSRKLYNKTAQAR